MTCKDCLHYDACLDNQGCGEFEFVTNVNYEDMKEWCGAFKNKADFVEVVRCKDCKNHYWEQEPCHGKIRYFCHRTNLQTGRYSFCSYGERQ